MADATVAFFLNSLKEVLLYSATELRKDKYIHSETRDEIKILEDNLETLLAIIKDSATNPGNAVMQAMTTRVQNVLGASYDAIDSFIFELAKHASRNRVKRFVKTWDHLRKVCHIAQEVKRINEHVKRIYEQKMLRSEQSGSVRREDPDWKFLSREPVAENDNVVGFDGAANELIISLRGGSMKLDVISIVGMVGLGKTTLIKKVYDHETIVTEFEHRLWVTVSKDRPIEDIFISILRDLGLIYDNTMLVPELRNRVKAFLQEKKYLIVLDDIWTMENWLSLKTAFPDNNQHSRILLTTQVKSIAENAHRNGIPYELAFLEDGDIVRLLEKMNLLGNGNPRLREYGESISKSCNGLPHAMVTIESTLRCNPSNRESNWENVVPRVNDLIVDNETRFAKVVALRVNSLHPNLKVCFFYFGLIPKGPIPVSKLIRLWIAEGFIKDESTLGLENTALKWLHELVDLSLVIATSWDFNHVTKLCKVHDSLHAFCRKEAEAQNLYRVIHMSNFDSLHNSSRVCVNSEVVRRLSSNSVGKNVRTLLTYPEHTDLKQDELETMLGAFEGIRILDISSITLSRFPKVLKKNHLLKFFSCSCDFEVVPSSISKLWSLETLLILRSQMDGRIIFDKKFWKLYKLTHLQTNASVVVPCPPPNQKLEKLTTFSHISPESCMKELFLATPNIQKLGVKGKLSVLLGNGSTSVESFAELKYLECLKLVNHSSTISNLSPRLPQLLLNLRELTFSGTFLNWQQINVLGDLEKLEALKLKKNAFKGQKWSVIDGSFPKLTFLNIDTTDLETWVANGNHQFKSLSRLLLRNCNRLVAFPDCLEGLRSFKTLDIFGCAQEVEQFARDLTTRRSLNLQIISSIN